MALTAELTRNYEVRLIEEDDQHFYEVPEHKTGRMPGVTGILDIVGGGKTHGLIGWAKKEALGAVRRALCARATGGVVPPVTVAELDDIIKQAKARPKALVDQAAEYGTRVHQILDRIVRGEDVKEVPDDLAHSVLAFRQWWAQSGITFVAPDTKIASLIHRYGGSLDWLGVKDGEYVLGDFKTSNGIRDTYALQVGGAYWQALQETFGIKAKSCVILRVDKVAPKRKTTQSWEVKWVKSMPDCLEAFLAAKKLSEKMKQPLYV